MIFDFSDLIKISFTFTEQLPNLPDIVSMAS